MVMISGAKRRVGVESQYSTFLPFIYRVRKLCVSRPVVMAGASNGVYFNPNCYEGKSE
jgi:hypothetical protein